MSPFIISQLARNDLAEILNFIAEDDLDAAAKFQNEIFAKLACLARIPFLGHRRTDLTKQTFGFGQPQSTISSFSENAEPLEILHITHGARDIKHLLS